MDLYWRPVVPLAGEILSRALKYAISRKLWDHDGTLGGEATLTHTDVPFLEGMIAAGNEEIRRDCQILIEEIKKHGAVVVWIQ